MRLRHVHDAAAYALQLGGVVLLPHQMAALCALAQPYARCVDALDPLPLLLCLVPRHFRCSCQTCIVDSHVQPSQSFDSGVIDGSFVCDVHVHRK